MGHLLISLLVGQEITSLYLTMNVALRALTAKRKYGLPMKLPNRLSPSPSQMRLVLSSKMEHYHITSHRRKVIMDHSHDKGQVLHTEVSLAQRHHSGKDSCLSV